MKLIRGRGKPFVVIPTPKSLSKEEKVTWKETVRVLNERPHLRSVPAEFKKKWSQKQSKIWEEAKLAIRRERKKM